MALNFETIKKIDANGTNVGMIKDSAGNILWRKKYNYCSLWHRATFIEAVRPGTAPHIRTEWLPYFSSSFKTLSGANDYFHYGDRVDLFQSLDGTKNAVVSWYDDFSADRPEQYASFLKTAAVTYGASMTVNPTFDRNIAAEGLLEAYGKIEKQTKYSDYGGHATDDTACLAIRQTTDLMPIVNSTVWDNMITGAGPHAAFYNQYYDVGVPDIEDPGGDNLRIEIEGAGHPADIQLFTAKITATCKTLPAVAFSWKKSDGSKGIITLKNAETTELSFDENTYIDLYPQSSYISSNGSILGSTSSSFVTISQDILTWLNYIFYVELKAVYPSKTINSKVNNYGFLMDANGNITNSNQKVLSSFCYCTMTFKRPAARFTKLRITYTQESEKYYDYGQFSKIDKLLCAYPVGDTASTGFGTGVVRHSCKGESNTEHVITYDISSLTVGTKHFINFKYHKDGSGDSGSDTFKISKIEFLEDCKYAFAYDSIKNTYGLTVRNDGKEMVEFDWHWFYIDGSSEDYTIFNAPSLSADIPAGSVETMWLTDFAIPEQSGLMAGIFECNGALHLFIQ